MPSRPLLELLVVTRTSTCFISITGHHMILTVWFLLERGCCVRFLPVICGPFVLICTVAQAIVRYF
jgi:hypothetical protein